MKGRIVGISGPTVTVEISGLRLYDRVAVGEAGLLGEAVRLERGKAVVQVYEETRGLAVGEPAKGLGTPLAVRLGPGLLNRMFDGLQRDLVELRRLGGPFLLPGSAPPLRRGDATLRFVPNRKAGERITDGDTIGCIEEDAFRHFILARGPEGVLEHLASGELQPDAPLAVLADGRRILAWHDWPVRLPRPYRRKLPCRQPLVTGQRCIDFLFPLARGGTAILPGGFGTGKTILEQSIAKFAAADIVVYVGCGERGNEMAEMLEEFAAIADPWNERPLMERTIVVVNTSNMPVAAREASIYTAVSMAEYYRDQGCHVLLLADSLSRWAEALREISSALEEMPGEEGYPTYLASRLAGFLARAGEVETLDGRTGSLSMILSVSPPGGDFTEPVTQACLRAAGAFLMLDTGLAHRRHFPAINWFQSYSLYEADVAPHFREEIDPRWEELQGECRALLQQEEALREVAEIVGTEGLQDVDRLLLEVADRVRREFLCQNAYTEDAFSPPERTLAIIGKLLDFHRSARTRLEKGVPLETLLQEMTS